MSPAGRIVSKLRQPLLGALASALLAGAILLWSTSEWQDARQENTAVRLRKQQMELLLNHATAEAGNIAERALRLQQLRESGVIGEEQREQWADMLEKLRQEREPLHLAYEFGAKTPLAESDKAIQSFATRLHLEAELRHETDLLQLVTRLEQQARALPAWQSCQLARLEMPRQGLRASCELSLITLLPMAGLR